MTLVICGSRNFNDFKLMDKIFTRYYDSTEMIISGGARGADALADRLANGYGLPFEEYPADWDKHGKSAGFVRNRVMAIKATHGIAFWDGKSKGTRHMISLMVALKKEILIVGF